jgi:hypothetical protein
MPAAVTARAPTPAPHQSSSSAGGVARIVGPVPRREVLPQRGVTPDAFGAGPALKLGGAPGKDPRFQRTMEKLQKSALKARSHQPAAKKKHDAQAAALPPANEKLAGAQANKVDTMKEAETGMPKPDSFLEMLRAEIKKVTPQKTEGVEDYMKGDDRQKLKDAMTGNVSQQKQEATAAMKSASDEPPDTSRVEGKPVTPLPSEAPTPAPPAVDAAEAMPAPKPESDVSLEQGKKNGDKLLTDAEVTTPQLQEANDSRFTAVITSKSDLEKHADAAPKQFRANEQGILNQAAAVAVADEKKSLTAFQSQGVNSERAIKARQFTAKEKDEQERKKVTDHIQSIFDRTKAIADKKLAGLDDEVTTMFDRGSEAAVEKMKKYVEDRFDDRYSGILGKGRWLKDKLLPLPDSVKEWFIEAHKVFLDELDNVVVRVANLVERRLKEAKDEIAKGQKEISEYVQVLPANLQTVGQAAEKEMQGRFDELRQGVESKKSDLAEKLAQRYKDATEKGAKALQELKDAHKSLYERVRDAIKAVIEILRNFKDRVLSLLKKAASVIGLIVAHPIRFLENLLDAIKLGLRQFVDNIWTHLKEGFMAWLFGSLADSGVTMPKDFSLPSILKLVLQVLGLTYERIRAKAVKLIGERNVALIEKVATVLKELVTGGPARLWEMAAEYLSSLKEMVVDAIQDWVITTVIKAAITKLATMFNPVGAIIQAILTIYNVITFLIERINQILAFVESVVNSVVEIATGAIGTAANWIEKALAKTIPIIISFLASLLGISGITAKIVGIIKKIQDKVDKAMDKVIGKIMGGLGKLFGGKGKEEDPEKAMKLTAGLAAIDQEDAKATKEGKQTREEAERIAGRVKRDHPVFKSITVVDAGNAWDYEYEASPGTKKDGLKKSGKEPEMKVTRKTGSLGGDMVGLEMKLDWLASEPAPGTKPEFGVQSKLMGLLITDPTEKSPDKYIRGHLLNEHLGGRGNAENMFPITGNANSQHLHSTEKRIKKWVSHKPKPAEPKRWVLYEVEVQGRSVKLDAGPKSWDNYVNSTFACHAILKDASGKKEEEFWATIPSIFNKGKQTAEVKNA